MNRVKAIISSERDDKTGQNFIQACTDHGERFHYIRSLSDRELWILEQGAFGSEFGIRG